MQSCMQPWQLDHQVLHADDCGRSVSFRAALGFPHPLRQISLGVFWSTGQQLQPSFPVAWPSSISTVPQALQLSHNEFLPPCELSTEALFGKARLQFFFNEVLHFDAQW